MFLVFHLLHKNKKNDYFYRMNSNENIYTEKFFTELRIAAIEKLLLKEPATLSAYKEFLKKFPSSELDLPEIEGLDRQKVFCELRSLIDNYTQKL